MRRKEHTFSRVDNCPTVSATGLSQQTLYTNGVDLLREGSTSHLLRPTTPTYLHPSPPLSICGEKVRHSSDNAHVHLAIVHSSKEWHHESTHPHNAQVLLVHIFRCCKTSAEGRDWWARRQTNNFSFEGTERLQILDHAFEISDVLDEPSTPSSPFSHMIFVSTNIRYADLTEKTPLCSKCHAQKSSIPLVHIVRVRAFVVSFDMLSASVGLAMCAPMFVGLGLTRDASVLAQFSTNEQLFPA